MADDATWQAFRAELTPRVTTTARNELASRFACQLQNRFEFGRLVGAARRDEPVHRWVPYKEAFAPDLVRGILDYLGVTSGILLDPFAGVGTSLLVAAERRMTGIGVELLAYPAFAVSTMLAAGGADAALVRDLAEAAVADRRRPIARFPDFPVRDWAFDGPVLGQLCRLDAAISEAPPGAERDLCRLALLTTVEAVSQATKDGTSLRRRRPGRRPGRWGAMWTPERVRAAFRSRAELIASDTVEAPPVGRTRCHHGDARALPKSIRANSVSVACFSPPYPNRYDYTANYQLELGFGFCGSAEALRLLRKSQLRSHLECPWADGRTVVSDALDEFLGALLASRRKGDEAGRVFRMVSGYFEDMAQVFGELMRVVRPGGHVAIVVGNQVFAGQPLPTDLILAEIAETVGFVTKSVWVARRKGVSTQQRLRLASVPESRESILILEA